MDTLADRPLIGGFCTDRAGKEAVETRHRVGDPRAEFGVQVCAIGGGEPVGQWGPRPINSPSPPQPACLKGQHGIIDRVLAERGTK